MSFNRKELKESFEKLDNPTKKKLNPNLKEESKIGYSGPVPSAQPWMDIYTPSGLIDMTDTNVPVLAEGRVLPPNSGMYQFDTPVVREYRLKKGGEWLNKYQGGGQRTPVFVTDPNDPRLKAYQDSLALFNSWKDVKRAMIRQGYSGNNPNLPQSGRRLRTEGRGRSYEDFFTVEGNDYIKKNPDGTYLIQDFKNEMVNRSLPPQLFNPEIKPIGVQTYADDDSFTYFNVPDYYDLNGAGAYASPVKQDVREIYEYANVNPRQEVILRQGSNRGTQAPTSQQPLTPVWNRYNTTKAPMIGLESADPEMRMTPRTVEETKPSIPYIIGAYGQKMFREDYQGKQSPVWSKATNQKHGGEWLQKYQEVGQVDPRFQPGLGFVKNFQQQQAAAEAYTNKVEGTTSQQRQVAAGINPLTSKPMATGMTEYPIIDPITAIMLPIAPEIAALGKLGNFALGALNPLEGMSVKDIRKLGKGSLKKVSDDIQNRLYNTSYKAGAWRDAAQGVIDNYNPYFGKDINKITAQNLKRHLGRDLSIDPVTGTRIGGFNTGVYEMKKNPNYAIKFESPNHPYFDDYKNIHYPDFFEGINSPNVAKVHKQMDIPKRYHPEPWLIDHPETEVRTLIMNKVPGKVLDRVKPSALRRIPSESYRQMYRDVDEIIKNKKFDIDLMGANIAYDPTKKSFGFYDLSPKTTANTAASQSWQRDVVSGLNPDAPDYKEELKNTIYKAMKNKSDFSMRNYLREYGKRLSREDREMFESEHLDKIYSNIEEGLKGLKKGGGWMEQYQNGRQVSEIPKGFRPSSYDAARYMDSIRGGITETPEPSVMDYLSQFNNALINPFATVMSLAKGDNAYQWAREHSIDSDNPNAIDNALSYVNPAAWIGNVPDAIRRGKYVTPVLNAALSAFGAKLPIKNTGGESEWLDKYM